MKKNRRKGTRARGGKQSGSEYYSSLPASELDKIAAPFERELIPTRPLTAAMRKQEVRARGRGRPVVGEGAARVLVTLEKSLLRDADAYALRHQKNRSALIALGLQAILYPRKRAS